MFQNLWELYTLLFAIVVGGLIAAFLLTAIVAAMTAIIANLSAMILSVGVLWELYIARTVAGLLIASAIICMETSPPTPPDKGLLICATLLSIISSLMGLAK